MQQDRASTHRPERSCIASQADAIAASAIKGIVSAIGTRPPRHAKCAARSCDLAPCALVTLDGFGLFFSCSVMVITALLADTRCRETVSSSIRSASSPCIFQGFLPTRALMFLIDGISDLDVNSVKGTRRLSAPVWCSSKRATRSSSTARSHLKLTNPAGCGISSGTPLNLFCCRAAPFSQSFPNVGPNRETHSKGFSRQDCRPPAQCLPAIGRRPKLKSLRYVETGRPRRPTSRRGQGERTWRAPKWSVQASREHMPASRPTVLSRVGCIVAGSNSLRESQTTDSVAKMAERVAQMTGAVGNYPPSRDAQRGIAKPWMIEHRIQEPRRRSSDVAS